LTGLTEVQKLLPLCPDFVIELRSPSDSLSLVHEKMQEYIVNGAQLGWLIDAERQQVHLYRPGSSSQILDKPMTLSGEAVLPGFILDLAPIWAADL
jgi:Uma2 family endonuclease